MYLSPQLFATLLLKLLQLNFPAPEGYTDDVIEAVDSAIIAAVPSWRPDEDLFDVIDGQGFARLDVRARGHFNAIDPDYDTSQGTEMLLSATTFQNTTSTLTLHPNPAF